MTTPAVSWVSVNAVVSRLAAVAGQRWGRARINCVQYRRPNAFGRLMEMGPAVIGMRSSSGCFGVRSHSAHIAAPVRKVAPSATS